jgi:hypothetical protein
MFLRPRPQRRQRIGCGAWRHTRADLLAGGDRRQAGTLIGLAIDGDQALEAGTHTAVQSTPLAASRMPVPQDAMRGQCRSDRLALHRVQRLPVIDDAQGLAAAADP